MTLLILQPFCSGRPTSSHHHKANIYDPAQQYDVVLRTYTVISSFGMSSHHPYTRLCSLVSVVPRGICRHHHLPHRAVSTTTADTRRKIIRGGSRRLRYISPHHTLYGSLLLGPEQGAKVANNKPKNPPHALALFDHNHNARYTYGNCMRRFTVLTIFLATSQIPCVPTFEARSRGWKMAERTFSVPTHTLTTQNTKGA